MTIDELIKSLGIVKNLHGGNSEVFFEKYSNDGTTIVSIDEIVDFKWKSDGTVYLENFPKGYQK